MTGCRLGGWAARGERLSRRGEGEGAEELIGGVVGGEEALNAEFVGADILSRAEGGDDREERDLHTVAGDLEREHGQESRIFGRPEEAAILVRAELGEDLAHVVAGGGFGFSLSTAPEQGRDGRPVDHVRTNALGMEKETHQIARGAADVGPEVGAEQSREPFKRRVGQADVPGTVDGDGGEGLVVGQHHADGEEDATHLRVVEGPGVEGGSEAAGDEPRVAFAQRDVERFADLEDHLAAGMGPAGFEKADVALRDAGGEGEIELGEAPFLAPGFEQVREAFDGDGRVDHGPYCAVCRAAGQ